LRKAAGEPEGSRVAEELDAARFLARSSAVLAQVSDYEDTLERIASLAVPTFADWFGVHVRERDGQLRRMAVRHGDPVMRAAVEEMYRRYPPAGARPYGAPAVIETGQPIFAPRFGEVIASVALDEEHARMLEGLHLRSFICVPMRSRAGVLGALTFATAESGRPYSDIHLRAAHDLAAHAAIAIENAHLLEALRETDRRKDEFIAMLAHELRNPLAPIRNGIELLRPRVAGDAQAAWAADVIDRQLRQLSRLVEDLLDVSRITEGKIELRTQRVMLASIMEAAVEAARPGIERAGVQLEVLAPSEPMVLRADPVRLAQVFSNLLNNAAKFTPRGGSIVFSVERAEGQAVVRVRDTGVGIPRAMLEKIFEPFVQANDSDHMRGGLGIGLTLVRRLAELHGGSVRAESDGPDRGSQFVVRLPLHGAQRGRA
jgi:signal transduction histidine kinase